jgi:hypothetical protein
MRGKKPTEKIDEVRMFLEGRRTSRTERTHVKKSTSAEKKDKVYLFGQFIGTRKDAVILTLCIIGFLSVSAVVGLLLGRFFPALPKWILPLLGVLSAFFLGATAILTIRMWFKVQKTLESRKTQKSRKCACGARVSGFVWWGQKPICSKCRSINRSARRIADPTGETKGTSAKERQTESADSIAGEPYKHWVCPKCYGLVRRPNNSELLEFLGRRGATVLTSARVECPGCGASYDRDAVQGGKYDVPYKDGQVFYQGSWRKTTP